MKFVNYLIFYKQKKLFSYINEKKSIKSPKKPNKLGKGKNSPLKKYKRARPPPFSSLKRINSSIFIHPLLFSKKNSVAYSLKHMSISQIKKIYDDIKKENLDFTFDCKILPSVHGRDMVKINSINGKT